MTATDQLDTRIGRRKALWADLGLTCCPTCGNTKPTQTGEVKGNCGTCRNEARRRRRYAAPYPSDRTWTETRRNDPEAALKNRARARLWWHRNAGQPWAQLGPHCIDCGSTRNLTADHHLGYDGDNWRYFQTVCNRCNCARARRKGL